MTGYGLVVGSWERGNEPSVAIKGGESLAKRLSASQEGLVFHVVSLLYNFLKHEFLLGLTDHTVLTLITVTLPNV
jgi:hypothetical protein